MRSSLQLLTVFTCLISSSFAVSADPITIMPLGDSITVGVNSTDGSGYRDPLYTDLLHHIPTFQFVGSTTSGSDTTLTNAGDAYHNGYGHYTIPNLDDNLAPNVPTPGATGDVQPVAADDNEGGDWLYGKPQPNIILLMIGTNDFLQQSYQNIDANILQLVTDIHDTDKNSIILIGGTIPIKGPNNTNLYGDAGETVGYYPLVLAYDSYIQNTLVNEVPNTVYVNQVGNFLNTDGTLKSGLYSDDGIHPDDAGYDVIAATWANAIEGVESPAEVPEPGTTALFGAGALVLLFFGVLRKKARATR